MSFFSRLRFGTGLFCLPLAVLGTATGCSDGPTQPIEQKIPSPVSRPPEQPPTAPSSPPPVAGVVDVYQRITPSSFGGESRYIIYDDSTFGLQYISSTGTFEYPGKFVRKDNVFTFNFSTLNLGGAWVAEGTLRDTDLTVKYNQVMSMSDFEDGTYRSSRTPQTAAGIYVANADGSNAVFLVEGNRPSWSPDDKRLVFTTTDGIHVIDANGGNDKKLTDGSSASWSPDGKEIVFANVDGIAAMGVDQSSFRLLIRHKFRTDTYAPWDMGIGNPVWSPDGAHIAFQHFGDGDMQPSQIFVMNADGSNVRRGTEPGNGWRYAESDPAWTPDGMKLLLWSYGTGISSVNANGGAPKSVLMDFPTVQYGARPTQSRYDVIAFTARISDAKSEIWAVPASGGTAKVLIANAYDPAFSSDGSKIAFVRR